MLTTRESGLAREATVMTTLYRYCVMGFGETFYDSESEQFATFTRAVIAACDADPRAAVATVAEARRTAPKAEPSIIALAIMCAHENAKGYAWKLFPEVVRNGSQLLTFVAVADHVRGWGRSMVRNIGAWYTGRNDLAYQLLKYNGRTVFGSRWTQRDVLRLAHPNDTDAREVFAYATHGTLPTSATKDAQYIRVVEALSGDIPESDIIDLIAMYGLPWEVIPTEKRTARVWAALVPHMGANALLRNMGNLAVHGVDPEVIMHRLYEVRTHPMTVLIAWYMYRQGHGQRSRAVWEVNQLVLKALEHLFYESFGTLQPNTNKMMVALDVSSSMTWNNYDGIEGLTPRTISAVLAMIHKISNPDTQFVAFCDTLTDFPITNTMRLDDVVAQMARMRFGGTYTALPIRKIIDESLETDSLIMYTDMQTADRETELLLRQLRQRQPIKFINVAMVPNKLSFAYSEDDLNVTGFSSDLPATIDAFIKL